MQYKPGESVLLALAVFHHYGLHSILGTSLYCGLKVVIMETWNTKMFFENIQFYKVMPVYFIT